MAECVHFAVSWIGGRLFFRFHEFGSLFKNKAAGNVAINYFQSNRFKTCYLSDEHTCISALLKIILEQAWHYYMSTRRTELGNPSIQTS